MVDAEQASYTTPSMCPPIEPLVKPKQSGPRPHINNYGAAAPLPSAHYDFFDDPESLLGRHSTTSLSTRVKEFMGNGEDKNEGPSEGRIANNQRQLLS
jgi:hypothetical protein